MRLGSLDVVPGTKARLAPHLQKRRLPWLLIPFISCPTSETSPPFQPESSAGFSPEQRDLLPMSQGLGHS